MFTPSFASRMLVTSLGQLRLHQPTPIAIIVVLALVLCSRYTDFFHGLVSVSLLIIDIVSIFSLLYLYTEGIVYNGLTSTDSTRQPEPGVPSTPDSRSSAPPPAPTPSTPFPSTDDLSFDHLGTSTPIFDLDADASTSFRFTLGPRRSSPAPPASPSYVEANTDSIDEELGGVLRCCVEEPDYTPEKAQQWIPPRPATPAPGFVRPFIPTPPPSPLPATRILRVRTDPDPEYSHFRPTKIPAPVPTKASTKPCSRYAYEAPKVQDSGSFSQIPLSRRALGALNLKARPRRQGVLVGLFLKMGERIEATCGLSKEAGLVSALKKQPKQWPWMASTDYYTGVDTPPSRQRVVKFDSEVVQADAADVRRSPPYWYNPRKYAQSQARAIGRCNDEVWNTSEHFGKPHYLSDAIDFFPDSSELHSGDDWRLEFMDEEDWVAGGIIQAASIRWSH